ncbi:Carrier domain-containing protein OS=Streptomyces antimycoticus OX=68175 GN=SANT12839_037320 PE=4 SV=1 [Streptomyces antimycoticus]
MALARHLRQEVAPEADGPGVSVLEELERLENSLSSLTPEDLASVWQRRTRPRMRTSRYVSRRCSRSGTTCVSRTADDAGADAEADAFEEVSDDDLFDFIDKRFGNG